MHLSANHPTPSGFVPAGAVSHVFLSPTPPQFIRKHKYTGRRALGVRYERKVQQHMLDRYGDAYTASPWLCFSDGEKTRWCQPDGLLLFPRLRRGIVCEIKYSHTERAWWQVRRLYIPVLQVLLPHIEFRALEIVKWFDPDVRFPEATAFCENPEDAPASAFGIHLIRP